MITPPVVAPAGAKVYEARPTAVTAVRLSAENVDAIQHWMRCESNADGIWNDHALYFTTPTGLAQANEGDWVVQTILGFEVYSELAFVAKFDRVVQPETPIWQKKTEPSVVNLHVPDVPLSKGQVESVMRRYANPLCGQHKDSAQFEGKQMVARVPLVEHQLTDILTRHAEATEER
jgi:hypothetical protein